MQFREFFRGLIGQPAVSSDENNNRHFGSNDVFHDFLGVFSELVSGDNGNSGDNSDRVTDQSGAGETGDDNFDWQSSHDDFGFSIFSETHDMLRQFEEHFRRSFQHFGLADFPPLMANLPRSLPGPGMDDDPAVSGDKFGQHLQQHPLPSSSPASLRDHLLKQPDTDRPHRDSHLDDNVREDGSSALFDWMTNRPGGSDNSNSDNSSSTVIPVPPRLSHRSPLSSYSSASSSVTVRTLVAPDGSMEERRVVVRPDGSTEETITRRQGHQRHMPTGRRHLLPPDGSTDPTRSETGPNDLLSKKRDEPTVASPNISDSNRVDNSFWSKLFG